MEACQKGIILAGGTGSRLYPLTAVSNKQLLPIYDKPAIYYPLTTLMFAGIKQILIISGHSDLPRVQNLLGSGDQYGLEIQYAEQLQPDGIPSAFIVGESFINQDPVALILGDNFFHGSGLAIDITLQQADDCDACIFTYSVDNPSCYGVVETDEKGNIIKIVEKPNSCYSNLAITGLYYFAGDVAQRAKHLRPSGRGELEIVNLIESYWQAGRLEAKHLGRGYAWFDVGTPESLLKASNYVEVIQSRQGVVIASPEEVAWRMKYIDDAAFLRLLDMLPENTYKHHIKNACGLKN